MFGTTLPHVEFSSVVDSCPPPVLPDPEDRPALTLASELAAAETLVKCKGSWGEASVKEMPVDTVMCDGRPAFMEV